MREVLVHAVCVIAFLFHGAATSNTAPMPSPSLKPSQDSHFSHAQRFCELDLLGPTLGPQILHVSGCPAELR
jgi:hypothetical protein